MTKYKPIKIHHIFFGYGYWWKDYFFFIGKHSTCFAIVPMYRECTNAVYASNGKVIGHGSTLSWSESRQRQTMEE